MKFLSLPWRLMPVLLLVICAGLNADQVVTQDFGAEWKSETKGPWRIRTDHRDLLAMRHPWEASEKGNFGLLYRTIRVPESWQGPFRLYFYCSDDYHTGDWRPDGSWMSAEGFIGHRFKQVLIDSTVVWNRDVSDPVEKGASPYQSVKIDVKPGQEFRLSVLVFDTEASTVVLKDDFYQYPENAKTRAQDPDAARFMTTVYWGDFALVDGDTVPPHGKRPSESKVRAVHDRRWPLPPFGDGWEAGTARLRLDAPVKLPKGGFPVRMGVPLPAGKVKEPGMLRLQTVAKKGIAAQKTVLSRWPDDSLRQVLFDFMAAPGTEAVDLAFTKEYARFAKKNTLKETESAVAVDTGAVRFQAVTGDLLSGVGWRGKEKISRVRLNLNTGVEEIPGSAAFFRVIEEGPFRTTVAVEGAFDTLARQAGSFVLYVSAWAGEPWLHCRLRVFNDSAEPLMVSALEMIFDLAEAPVAVSVQGKEIKGAFTLKQETDTARLLDGEAVDSEIPALAVLDDLAISVVHFSELFPRALRLEDNRLIADLTAGGNRPVIFTPGEAKTHDIWLAGGGADGEAMAALAEKPPVLSNPEYFCATGILGPAATHENVEKIERKMQEMYGGKSWRDLGLLAGQRHYPDSPYYGGLPAWSNNYYERMLNLWSEWLMSGDRFWYDLAVDVCDHLMDVGIVHSAVPGEDWVGALHGPGKNHVAAPWNPTLRITGMDLYHKITGAPESLEAVLGVGDFCVRRRAGIDGGSSRQQAGPFDSIITAYMNTGEMRFIDEGAARVESVLRSMDRRRGVWQDTHGSQVYRGNIPWMAAQVARPLYWWYYLAGDVEAAQALVGLAESMICENTDWDTPGAMYGYSHNPHFEMSAAYDPLILPVIFAAYELTEDEFFLDAAKTQWKRWEESDAFDSIFNCWWNTPWLMWYLEKYDVLEEAATEETAPESPGEAPEADQADTPEAAAETTPEEAEDTEPAVASEAPPEEAQADPAEAASGEAAEAAPEGSPLELLTGSLADLFVETLEKIPPDYYEKGDKGEAEE